MMQPGTKRTILVATIVAIALLSLFLRHIGATDAIAFPLTTALLVFIAGVVFYWRIEREERRGKLLERFKWCLYVGGKLAPNLKIGSFFTFSVYEKMVVFEGLAWRLEAHEIPRAIITGVERLDDFDPESHPGIEVVRDFELHAGKSRIREESWHWVLLECGDIRHVMMCESIEDAARIAEVVGGIVELGE